MQISRQMFYTLKACWNRKHFSALRNCFSFGDWRMPRGRLFHIRGPIRLKALSPYRVRVRGVWSNRLAWDLRLRDDVHGAIKSQMYCGAEPCVVLNTITAILNSTRCFTGSQCRCLSIFEADDSRGKPVTTRPAVFITRCSFCNNPSGRPASRALQ